MKVTTQNGIDKSPLRYVIQLSDSRDAVWVHASDGSTVGRFGKMGIDIHSSITEQLNGAPQCDLCTHGRVTAKEWATFRTEASLRWGVTIDEDAFDHRLFLTERKPSPSF